MMSGDDSSLVMEDRGSNDEPKKTDYPKKTKTEEEDNKIGEGNKGYNKGSDS